MKLLLALLVLAIGFVEAARAGESVSVCFSKAGTRFDRLTAKECAAQGWEMREVSAEDAAQALEGSDAGGASRMCRDGRWRIHCDEDGEPAERASSAQAATAEQAAAQLRMSARCGEEWPSDFRMQVHCIERQQEGARQAFALLQDPAVKGNAPLEQALVKCSQDWTDAHGYNFPMVAHCMEGQISAFKALR